MCDLSVEFLNSKFELKLKQKHETDAVRSYERRVRRLNVCLSMKVKLKYQQKIISLYPSISEIDNMTFAFENYIY